MWSLVGFLSSIQWPTSIHIRAELIGAGGLSKGGDIKLGRVCFVGGYRGVWKDKWEWTWHVSLYTWMIFKNKEFFQKYICNCIISTSFQRTGSFSTFCLIRTPTPAESPSYTPTSDIVKELSNGCYLPLPSKQLLGKSNLKPRILKLRDIPSHPGVTSEQGCKLPDILSHIGKSLYPAMGKALTRSKHGSPHTDGTMS